MKINGSIDTNQYTVTNRCNTSQMYKDTKPIVQAANGDVVEFGFKDASKSFSSTGYTKLSSQSASAQKIAELKTQYNGDNCPVSDRDIATAIISNLCGII